eukprot:14473265-Alexandrium_andersonii.AAC.1
MSASLVGSEMCIRDSPSSPRRSAAGTSSSMSPRPSARSSPSPRPATTCTCLLYTSDAADDM